MDLLSVEDIESLCKVSCVYLIFIEVIFNNFCKANICLFWNSSSQDSGRPPAQDGSVEDPIDFCDIV